MKQCRLCGDEIDSWFEVCYTCYNPKSRSNGKIPDPIMANGFMKEMKIELW